MVEEEDEDDVGYDPDNDYNIATAPSKISWTIQTAPLQLNCLNYSTSHTIKQNYNSSQCQSDSNARFNSVNSKEKNGKPAVGADKSDQLRQKRFAEQAGKFLTCVVATKINLIFKHHSPITRFFIFASATTL